MNEEQFRSELYRHLVNEIEDSERKLKVTVEEPCFIQQRTKTQETPRADMVIYDNYDVPTLIIEIKTDNSQISQAVTQIYRYGFYFGMPEYGFVAVCTPNILLLYQYDGELGEMAHETPKDVEGGIYVAENGHKFSWEIESKKRLVEKHELQEKSVSDIAQCILDFLQRKGEEEG